MSLTAKKILITRPLLQGEQLKEELKRLGAEVFHHPILEITYLINEKNIHNYLANLPDSFESVIVTSQNSVHPLWLAPLLQRCRIGKFLCIGPATFELLSQFKLSHLFCAPSPYTSESLLAMPELQNVQNDNILLLTGEGGRHTLEETLNQRQAHLYRLETYARKPTSWMAFQQILRLHKYDMVIITSSEGVMSMLSAMLPHDQEILKNLPVIVYSARLKGLLMLQGFSKIFVAKNATDLGVLSSLKEIFS